MGLGGLPVFPDAVHVPVQGGWVDSRIPDIARAVHALSGGTLTLVARCNKRTGQAMCYDLFERVQGREHWVTRWALDEVDRILEDVRRSDRRAAEYVPVQDRIRAQHEAMYRDNAREAAELDEAVADVDRFVQGARDGEHVSWLITDTKKPLGEGPKR